MKMRRVSIRLPESLMREMDRLVRNGVFQSKSHIVRVAVRELLRKELMDEELLIEG